MKDWISLDRQYVWHPFTQMLTAPPPVPVERAEGIYLYTSDGRKILDGVSSWWVNIHGHSHPRLIRALANQAAKLQQVVFAGCTHEPAARLAAKLVEITPDGLEHAFYSDDGSTAVEVALKMAAQYWQMRGEPQKDLFVALEHAYHGDTFGAMAAGGIPLFHETFHSMLFEVARAPAPYSYAFDGGRDPEACVESCRRALEEIFRREKGRVAALIIEPMLQGAGGMIVWPRSYLRVVRDLCDAHDVLLIADEVLTGFGRTGKLFACEHGPVTPDIICVSKGLTGGYLPLAVTLCTRQVYEAFLTEDRSKTFFHGHSFTGNALSCAVALESLAIFEEEGVLARIGEIERLFGDRLERLRKIPLVGDARGIGTLAAVELGSREGSGYLDALGPRLHRKFLERDILLRPLGNVLYFLPPYVVTDEEVHRVFDAMEEVLEEES